MADSEKILPLYERHANWYDAARSKNLMEAPYLRLALPAAHVLDLGCGTGQPIAEFFIELGCYVTGIDGAVAMIAKCRERFPEMEWLVADMRELDLGETFDAIIAWDSFFHLSPDSQRLMFPVFKKHAAQGATLIFTSGPEHGEAIGEMQGEPLYHASLAPAEYRQLLADHGFDVVKHVVNDPECGGHTVWVAKYAA